MEQKKNVPARSVSFQQKSKSSSSTRKESVTHKEREARERQARGSCMSFFDRAACHKKTLFYTHTPAHFHNYPRRCESREKEREKGPRYAMSQLAAATNYIEREKED